MTETQRPYKSDARVDLENKILESEEAFCIMARMYLEKKGEIESFLDFCWDCYKERRKEIISEEVAKCEP